MVCDGCQWHCSQKPTSLNQIRLPEKHLAQEHILVQNRLVLVMDANSFHHKHIPSHQVPGCAEKSLSNIDLAQMLPSQITPSAFSDGSIKRFCHYVPRCIKLNSFRPQFGHSPLDVVALPLYSVFVQHDLVQSFCAQRELVRILARFRVHAAKEYQSQK